MNTYKVIIKEKIVRTTTLYIIAENSCVASSATKKDLISASKKLRGRTVQRLESTKFTADIATGKPADCIAKITEKGYIVLIEAPDDRQIDIFKKEV